MIKLKWHLENGKSKKGGRKQGGGDEGNIMFLGSYLQITVNRLKTNIEIQQRL